MRLSHLLNAIVFVIGLHASICFALQVATSIPPLSMILKEIVEEETPVITILPPSADPHHFELTPSIARTLAEADIVFIIGQQFDGWAIDGAAAGKRTQYVAFADLLQDSLLSLGAAYNPHIWLDPLIAKRIARIMAERLCAIDSLNCSSYLSRLDSFSSRIDSLDRWLREELQDIGFRRYVSFHPAWSYFARRYGLEELAVIEPMPEQEPSPRRIAEIIRMMKKQHVGFILVERTSNPSLVAGLAEDTGARVIILDPLGSCSDSLSYFMLMKQNLSKIRKAVLEN